MNDKSAIAAIAAMASLVGRCRDSSPASRQPKGGSPRKRVSMPWLFSFSYILCTIFEEEKNSTLVAFSYSIRERG